MPSRSLDKPRKRDYSTEDIDRGLSAVAYFEGNTRAAARALSRQGFKISHNTLRGWMDRREPERYLKLKHDLLPRIHAAAAEKHAAMADDEIAASRILLTDLLTQKDELAPRDLSTAIRNLDVGSGVHRDKSLTLRGEATSIVRHEDSMALLRSLRAKGVEVEVIEGSAVEVGVVTGQTAAATAEVVETEVAETPAADADIRE